MNSTTRNLASIARSLAAGYLYGPRRTCVCCGKPTGDADSINKGNCLSCWKTIRTQKTD